MAHGTRYEYIRYKCRCKECTAANTDYTRESRKRRNPIHAPRHGKHTIYINWNCLRKECTTAFAAWCKKEYHRRKGADFA